MLFVCDTFHKINWIDVSKYNILIYLHIYVCQPIQDMKCIEKYNQCPITTERFVVPIYCQSISLSFSVNEIQPCCVFVLLSGFLHLEYTIFYLYFHLLIDIWISLGFGY